MSSPTHVQQQVRPGKEEDLVQWIQENTFYCPAHEARISAPACASYRKGHKGFNTNSIIMPAGCGRCKHYPKDAEPLKRPRPVYREGVKREKQ